MKKTSPIRSAYIFLITAAVMSTVSAQSEKNILKKPDQLKWADMPTLQEGAKLAIIEGNLQNPGPFTFHLKLPAGFVIPGIGPLIINFVNPDDDPRIKKMQ